MYKSKCIYLLLVLSLFFSSCSKENKNQLLNTKPISLKKFDVPIGADPNVPADLGGKGFDGKNWLTNNDKYLKGNSDAVKGGTIVLFQLENPTTIRTEGKESNTQFSQTISDLLYESLLKKDDVSGEYVPSLATHWQISEDKKTFRFRINPDARWADGNPVIADDIIASWKLLTDAGILSPYTNEVYNSFEMPVAESKYIVKVTSKDSNWRKFYYFANVMKIYPAHIIGNISGKEYLEKFQNDYVIGSGPYAILKEDFIKDQYVIIRRRSDYWAEKEKFNIGYYNFDEIKILFITDENLAFEKFKKGEIDIMQINRSQMWAERFDFDFANRGLIQKLSIANLNPKSISGIALNMRKNPFNDIKIRKAFSYLYDRKKFNEKLFYSSYDYITSFFQGSDYANENNPLIGFNLDSASMLLAESGWKDKNSDGYLIKDGNIFEVDLPFSKPMDRYLTVFQEDLKKVGIKLNLRELDMMTMFNMGNERKFEMLPVAYNGLFIPNPESFLSSSIADSLNTGNITGIKDKIIDSLLISYDNSYSDVERKTILKEIDKIAVNYFAYIFGWTNSRLRIAYQNKFDYPEFVTSMKGGISEMLTLWYFNNNKLNQYYSAKENNSVKLKINDIENNYWLKQFNKK